LCQAQRIDQATKYSGDQHQQRMFQTPIQQVNLVELPSLPVEDAFDAMELLGFPLINPFELIAGPTGPALLAKDLPNYIGKVVSVYGYLVTIKNTSTIHRDRMLFGTFLDREGRFIDTIHFPEITKRYPVTGLGIYRLAGKVTEEFGVISLEVSQCSPLPYVKDPRYST
ncbi:MAG TPA: DNA polymerase III subunit alpha, partial [Bacteroidetes bacterium]|nr:DNA polymerase III subunit alpha [Bacteroidota bacterium]